MPYAAAKVRMHLHEVIRANKITEGCARIYLIYNNAGFWQSDEPRPKSISSFVLLRFLEYADSAGLGLRAPRPTRRRAAFGSRERLPGGYRLGRGGSRKDGFDEVVLLNERSEVSDAPPANIFVVKNGKVLTPPCAPDALKA